MSKLRKSAIVTAAILVALTVVPALAQSNEHYGSMHVNSLNGNNLANLEALLNIIANGGEILGISNGFPILFLGIVLLFLPDRRKLAGIFIPLGLVAGLGGIALPGLINWLPASAPDPGVFK